MKKQEVIQNWLEQAKMNWKTANNLYKSKDYYACLFFCHLTIEKILKGLVLQNTDGPAPYTHDLEKLSQVASLSLEIEALDDLKVISEFNILTRYDDQKEKLFQKYNKIYATKYFGKTKLLYLWLKKQYQKKS